MIAYALRPIGPGHMERILNSWILEERGGKRIKGNWTGVEDMVAFKIRGGALVNRWLLFLL